MSVQEERKGGVKGRCLVQGPVGAHGAKGVNGHCSRTVSGEG